MSIQEHSESLETQTPTIRLEVFRHDEKDLADEDHVAQLTTKGKLAALEAGRKKQPHLNEGYVVASPRERALHSAILQFFGPQIEDLDLHNVSLQEALGKLKEHESKIKTDERLNFHVESHPEFNARFYDEYGKKEGNRTLDFQREDSDQMILGIAKRIKNINDDGAVSVMKIKGFKRMVGDLAEVLYEYFQKLPTWKKSFEQNPKDYDSSEMQIFIGTHSQNVECFLMKIIEMKLGPQALEDFLKQLDNRKSFIGYSEGFSLTVEEKDGQPSAVLQFKNSTFQITEQDLKTMVQERDEFNEQVQQKIEEDPDAV